MTGIIRFIEDYLSRDSGHSMNVFRVNIDRASKGGGIYLRDLNHHTVETITLDEEDLKYLYDKYLPLYYPIKEEERKKQEEYKQRQIKELEDKIAKLKG